jgi:hypothetical protein
LDPRRGGVYVPCAVVQATDIIESHEALRALLVFAAAAIKSGEGWTDICEEKIGSVLQRDA